MKLPINFSILKFFTTVDKATVDDLLVVLRKEYGNNRSITKPSVMESVMTAESNGLVQEVGYELDNNGELQVYYATDAAQRAEINKYIR